MKLLLVLLIAGAVFCQTEKTASTAGVAAENTEVKNADEDILKQIFRDVSKVAANTTALMSGLEANTLATKKEKGMCKNAMRAEVGLIEERAGSTIHNRIAEQLVEYHQLYRTYTPCDVGNVFTRLQSFMKEDKTCVAEEFNKRTLDVAVTFAAGKPEITLQCTAASCYTCLANTGCNLDTLLASITDQSLTKLGMLPAAKNYIGNHQMSFNGKTNFIVLPRLYEYTPEFTFEAWVAWEPEQGFNMEGATAKIFDFFAKEDRRGENRADAGQSNTLNGAVTRVGANGVEYRRAMDLLVSEQPSTKTNGEDNVVDEDGDFSLKFRKHHVVSAQWVSGASLSPGSYRPPEVTEKTIPTPPELVPVRLVVDNVEVLGEKPLDHGRWQHVAATVQKTEDASEETDCCWKISLYVDGDRVAQRKDIPLSQIRPDRMMYVVDTNFLGRNQNGDEKGWFKGYMDEVRMWRVARTPEQINGYMHRPVSGVDENLFAYYRFDELRHSGRVDDHSLARHNGHLGEPYNPETHPHRVSIRHEALPEMGA